MQDNNASSFYVNVTHVVFSDDSRWSKSGKEFSNDAKKAAEISLEIGKEVGEKALEAGKKGAKKLLPLIINILVSICFFALAFVGITDMDGTPQSYIALIGTFLSAILSLPGMGKLIFHKKYKLPQMIIRWVIVVAIVVIVLNINRIIS